MAGGSRKQIDGVLPTCIGIPPGWAFFRLSADLPPWRTRRRRRHTALPASELRPAAAPNNGRTIPAVPRRSRLPAPGCFFRWALFTGPRGGRTLPSIPQLAYIAQAPVLRRHAWRPLRAARAESKGRSSPRGNSAFLERGSQRRTVLVTHWAFLELSPVDDRRFSRFVISAFPFLLLNIARFEQSRR